MKEKKTHRLTHRDRGRGREAVKQTDRMTRARDTERNKKATPNYMQKMSEPQETICNDMRRPLSAYSHMHQKSC